MKSGKLFTKIALVAFISGFIGGGAVYGGVSLLNNSGITQSVPSGSSSSGTAKFDNKKINVQTQATNVYDNNKDSVVSVVNKEKTSNNNDSSSLFGDIFGGNNGKSGSDGNSDSSLEKISEGSGVIYRKANNAAYIVTNNHVVAGSSSLEVILSNGKKLSAKLVGSDTVTDLAVLKINGSSIDKVANFGNSNNINVGETSLAIGSPLGSDYASSLTQGVISAKKRQVQQATSSNSNTSSGYATVIQTDAAINPGNSGGPLLNLAGQVIGINSMKLSTDSSGTSVEGMGFAIPSNEVTKIINQLVKNGKVTRPKLGIKYIDLSNIAASDQKSRLKLPSKVSKGVVVMQSVKNSPAKKAGLKEYDVITKLDGQSISSQGKLQSILYQHKVGDKVSVEFYRGGKLKTSTITLNQAAD